MKKLFLLLIISFATTFTSCKKDYNCNCKDADGFTWGTYTINNVTKKKAKAACSSHDELFTSVTATCELE